MSNIHFFTEVDLLNQQQANEAFGPLPDANGKNRYQVASLHTASSDPKALFNPVMKSFITWTLRN